MYKVIDIENWNRKSQYEWFKTFSNPCYGIDVDLDVTEVVKYTKETKTSFFINILYLITKGLNQVPSMRLRIVNDEVRLYDICHPTYTVSNLNDTFDNCGNKMADSYHEFYNLCKTEVDNSKNSIERKLGYNSDVEYNVFYMTCLPWLYYSAMSHPLPDNNIESSSVPRICWSKYKQVNDRYLMKLNITVSHVLVDGKPLCETFNLIQELCINCREYFKS